MMMIRRNLTTRDIWSYYWAEKNKNTKKVKKSVDKQNKMVYNK